MRLLLLLCCSILFTHLVFAQEYFNPYNDVKPKITGKLIGYDPIEDAELTLLFSLVSPTQARNGKKTIVPEKDGRFELILDHPFRYQQIWFKIGEYYYAQLIADKELISI